MRELFHRVLTVTAVSLALTGGAWAQSGTAPDPQIQDAPGETTPAVPATLEAVPPADPNALAPGLAGADAAIAAKLRDIVIAGLGRPIERKSDRAGVEAFYRARGFAPLWTADGAMSPRANAAAAFLGRVDADGLDPADYPVPRFSGPETDKLAQDELAMTNSVLAFARHARTGRISFSRVSGAIFYELATPEAADVLANMANADDLRDALNSYHPPHPAYQALKAKLAETRAGKKNAALSDTLIANMERWRWVPRELGKAHVVVNIPDYTLKVVNNGTTAWTTRIVVGKVGAQATPLFSETMKFITVNPTWNVPPSIIRNEYLPALARDPGALERIGLKITHKSDGTIRIYQPPGEKNALGRIRFNFPNRFLVYQHDTPQKNLFAQAQRAYSHGCMRVQDPEKYAEVLLSISQPEESYTAERVQKMYGSRERNINLKTALPVHVTYQTAYIDDAGQFQTRPDIYGHDRTITDLLRNGRGTDTPIARNTHSSSKPVAARVPSRPDDQARRLDGYFNQGSGRVARRFDFEGSTFYPRRSYGAPN